ncbi:MAG: DNA repair protein RecN [Alphaproteobacteria bacterium]|nr:DNA repair protein RecN [Alphaproteobacteria bacterium]
MLASVTIRDIVLIDKVDVSFDTGLCALTGETGAGKSILLDALGLALGMRANAGLVRTTGDSGVDSARASVSASFDLVADDPVFSLLSEHDITPPEPGEPLILRRNLDKDGRGRAFINDQPVSVALLRQAGESLVEIEGQFASHGLMDQATHRESLDGFANLKTACVEVSDLYRAWRDAETALSDAVAALEQNRADEEYLRHALAELAELDPQPGEETELAEARALLMNGERLVAAMASAEKSLSNGDGVEDRLAAAQRVLAHEVEAAAGRLDAVMDALAIANDAVADAEALLHRVMVDAEPDPAKLEFCEERLFAIRAMARKHNLSVEELPTLRANLQLKLAQIDDAGGLLEKLQIERDRAYENYKSKAEDLSQKRLKAAIRLDKAVAVELPPLKLEKATFTTRVETVDEKDWGPTGIDRIHFEVTTNPGAPSGPLARIASGGELARFLLALKVVLHQSNAIPTLIFDEVDSGIGGAVAAAVGERLAKLAESVQVLAITHSPQVASCAMRHLQIAKSENKGVVTTNVSQLSEDDRQEEIARMLAGTHITDEARAAAASLMSQESA